MNSTQCIFCPKTRESCKTGRNLATQIKRPHRKRMRHQTADGSFWDTSKLHRDLICLKPRNCYCSETSKLVIFTASANTRRLVFALAVNITRVWGHLPVCLDKFCPTSCMYRPVLSTHGTHSIHTRRCEYTSLENLSTRCVTSILYLLSPHSCLFIYPKNK